MEGHVVTTNSNGVAVIEFHHPKGNSLPAAILARLAEAIRAAGADENALLIVLRSAGDKAFCAGASFDELKAIRDEAEGRKFFMGFANVINAMRSCGKLIIGRVQGRCVGGGVGLAAATDYCLATAAAEVKLSELAVGIGPFVVGPAVERKIGTAAFSQLSIDCTEWQTATWAREKGLFADIFNDIGSLDSAVYEMSEKLRRFNPGAMREIKSMLWKGTEDWDRLLPERAAISGRLVLSEFTRNALDRMK